MPTNKIFIGNLSYSATAEDLKQSFESFGKVTEAKIVFDRPTGRSRGFGFVTFESADAAQEALREMNGKEMQGRPIRVNEARDKQEEHG